MLRARLNGKDIEAPEGSTVLDALRANGFDVPSSCYDTRLAPYGACRQCLVRVNGAARPVASCTTPLTEGMMVDSEGDEIRSLHKGVLRQLADRYPKGKGSGKEFYRYLRQYGLEAAGEERSADESHPYISADMSQCIYCYRCVRICEELQGQFVWQAMGRGDDMRIVSDSGGAFGDSTCVSCGACVDTCPTGALEDKSIIEHGAPDNWTRTTCPYCGVGCEMEVGTKNGRLVAARPVLDSPVNKGHLCVKGRYAFEFVHADDRITKPMIRREGDWQAVSWEEAIAFTASEMNRLVANYGPQSVGVLGSARGTNEESYLAQKFARLVLGTNNVDCCARVCHAPSAAAMKMTLGTGAATSSFDDIELAKTILLCGTNATENHPVVGARIKQAALRGAKLIVIDPRKIELSEYAQIHLQLRPGTNIPLLHAIAHCIIEEGLADESFIAARTNDYGTFKESAKEWSAERAAEVCDVSADDIRAAARLYADHKPSICFHGLGMTEHTQGTEGVIGIVNLALLTGNIGKPGTGVNPLRGQNNVQGSAHMGCDPNSLTGGVDIVVYREEFEAIWGAAIPREPGWSMLKMVDHAGKGDFKGLWAIGYDVFLSNANASATAHCFQNMELVVIQDMFMTETAKHFGTVFLPCASSFERDGTFMNSERRVQRIRKAIEPIGDCRSDWQIICMIAKEMGKGELFAFSSPEEIWDEIRKVWKAGAGISYHRIEEHGIQWPCPTEAHAGTTMLHAKDFPIGDRASFRKLKYTPTEEVTNGEFPFLLVTGRDLYQFNAGTMTGRTKNNVFRPSDTLDCSPDDATRLSLKDGERVVIKSRYGEATLPLRITNAVKPGELFATFHTPELFLNYATSPYRDRYVGAPEYKVTAVRIEHA